MPCPLQIRRRFAGAACPAARPRVSPRAPRGRRRQPLTAAGAALRKGGPSVSHPQPGAAAAVAASTARRAALWARTAKVLDRSASRRTQRRQPACCGTGEGEGEKGGGGTGGERSLGRPPSFILEFYLERDSTRLIAFGRRGGSATYCAGHWRQKPRRCASPRLRQARRGGRFISRRSHAEHPRPRGISPSRENSILNLKTKTLRPVDFRLSVGKQLSYYVGKMLSMALPAWTWGL